MGKEVAGAEKFNERLRKLKVKVNGKEYITVEEAEKKYKKEFPDYIAWFLIIISILACYGWWKLWE